MRKKFYLVNAIEVIKILKTGRKMQATIEYDAELGMFKITPHKLPCARRNLNVIGHTDFGHIGKTFKKYHWNESLPAEFDAEQLADIIKRDSEKAMTIIAFDQIMDQV